MNPENIKDNRALILRNNPQHYVVRKGNRAVGYLRHCCICGRPLTAYINNEDRYVTICAHYQISVMKLFKLSMCKDIHSCYSTLERSKQDEQ